MMRVRLSCNSGREKYPHAPMLAGRLRLDDFEAPALFLVDTGADHTVIGHHSFHLPIEHVKKGHPQITAGVGGHWPQRFFEKRAILSVLAEDPDSKKDAGLALEIPKLYVSAPYAETRGEKLHEEWGHVPPSDRRLQGRTPRLRKGLEIIALLGRDVIVGNRLRLEYDPEGTSYLWAPHILLPVPSPVAIADPGGAKPPAP